MIEKRIKIRTSDIATGLSNDFIAEFDRGHFRAAPRLNYNVNERIGTFNGLIDNNIGWPGTVQTDDEYIIMCSWGQGFGVNVIDNAGVITNIFHELRPNANYQYYHCLSLDRVRKIAYIANYVHDGVTQYDFNGNWTNTPVKTVYTSANSNLQDDELGHTYHNGMFMAGDWLYVFPEDRTIYDIPRWNPYTDVAENYAISGTTRYTRYGTCFYSEEHDMGCVYSPNSMMCLILNASSTTPTIRFVNVDSQGAFTSYGTLFMPDPNDINILYCGGNYRYAKLDITDVIAGTTNVPTWLINTYVATGDNHPYAPGRYLRAGGNGSLNSIANNFSDVLPLTYGDGGHYETIGFLDMERMIPVRFDNPIYATSSGTGTGRHLRYDYGNHPVKVLSPNNTEYWLMSGHGDSDSSVISIFTSPPQFSENSWRITTNGLQLDNTNNVKAVQVLLDENTMTNSTSTIEVTNDNGTTWQTYTSGIYVFTTTGNTVRVRYSVNNTVNTSNYIYGTFEVILYEIEPYQPVRYLTTRITGGV